MAFFIFNNLKKFYNMEAQALESKKAQNNAVNVRDKEFISPDVLINAEEKRELRHEYLKSIAKDIVQTQKKSRKIGLLTGLKIKYPHLSVRDFAHDYLGTNNADGWDIENILNVIDKGVDIVTNVKDSLSTSDKSQSVENILNVLGANDSTAKQAVNEVTPVETRTQTAGFNVSNIATPTNILIFIAVALGLYFITK